MSRANALPTSRVATYSDDAALADALRQAQPFDKFMASDDQRVSNLALYVYDHFIARKNAPKFLSIRDVLVCLLLNLYSAYLNDPERFVRYSRDPKRYGESRYNPLPVTWKKLHRLINDLTGKAIEHYTGIPGFNGFKDGRQSRMRALPMLSALMTKDFGFTLDVIQFTREEVIILRGFKDEEGKAEKILYKPTKFTEEARRNVLKINSFLADRWIDIRLTDAAMKLLNERLGRDNDRVPIDFRRKRLRRIFNNNSFKQGGRFYHAWWQEVPSEYRKYIFIDGQQTTEVDFSGMHFQIFYAEVDAEPPADPYALPNIDPSERGMVKKALNALINAGTELAALRAIRSEATYTPLPKAYPTADVLVSALKRLHAPIAHLFGTAEGLKAQFIDSQIAERVMLTLAAEGIPALTVHDSFIVPTSKVDRLSEVMHESFEAVTGAKCPLKEAPRADGEPPEDEATRKAYEQSGKDPFRGYHTRLAWRLFGRFANLRPTGPQ